MWILWFMSQSQAFCRSFAVFMWNCTVATRDNHLNPMEFIKFMFLKHFLPPRKKWLWISYWLETKSQDYTSIVLQLEQWPERYVGLVARGRQWAVMIISQRAPGLPICSWLGRGWVQWHVPVPVVARQTNQYSTWEIGVWRDSFPSCLQWWPSALHLLLAK